MTQVSLDKQPSSIVEGDWEKGKPQTGKGIIFAIERYYYEGPVVEGLANGEGKIIWPNRYVYHGSVKNNQASGEGELQIEEKALSIKGTWLDGLPKTNHKFELRRGATKGSITFLNDS